MVLRGRHDPEIKTLGCADEFWPLPDIFVSTLFEIDIKLKRYEGGLVHFDGSTSHIDLTRFSDRLCEGQLHCLYGFWLTLLTESTSNRKDDHWFQ